VGECREELRAIVLPARFNFDVFAEQATVGDMGCHGLALRVEAEPAFALPPGRHPQVTDECAIHRPGLAEEGGNTPVVRQIADLTFHSVEASERVCERLQAPSAHLELGG
jgi:hypothetical protein